MHILDRESLRNNTHTHNEQTGQLTLRPLDPHCNTQSPAQTHPQSTQVTVNSLVMRTLPLLHCTDTIQLGGPNPSP